MRNAVDNSRAPWRRRSRDPAPVVALHTPLVAHALWTALWKSQECPQRAAFRCRLERPRNPGRASIRSPRPRPTGVDRLPACAEDALCHAARSIHTRRSLDRRRGPHPRRPLADGLRRLVLHHARARAGRRRARGRGAQRVHAILDRGPLLRARAQGGERCRPGRLCALPRRRRRAGGCACRGRRPRRAHALRRRRASSAARAGSSPSRCARNTRSAHS